MPQGKGAAGPGGGNGGLVLDVERQTASVAGIMSSSEFSSLELTENTRKVMTHHDMTHAMRTLQVGDAWSRGGGGGGGARGR